jgi:hypothetical protein
MKKDHRRCCYDVESFQNFASYAFKDTKSGERHVFCIFADKQDERRNLNQTQELFTYVEERCSWLIGYNSLSYDDAMLLSVFSHLKRYKHAHPGLITQELYNLSQTLINAQKEDFIPPEVYTLRKRKRSFRSLDLIQLFNRVDRQALKQLAINMYWPRIEDLPFSYDHIVLHSEIPKIISYNNNDVDITEAVMIKKTEEINNRIAFTLSTGVDVINSCDSDIGKKVIAAEYEKRTGTPYKVFKDWRTSYETLALKDCISPRVKFETPYYKRILEQTMLSVIDPNKKQEKGKKRRKQFEIIIKSKYLTHTMGLGGLHSNNPSEILQENDEYCYIDIDAAGYYPWLFILEMLYPKHLGPAFTEILREAIVEKRMKIKKKDPVQALMLKYASNAPFGMTKSRYSYMYDPHCTTYCCLSGQMFLFMLMEALETHTGCMVVYSNTDGLTVKVPRAQINQFYHICRQWEINTGFELEYVQYKRMILRDVGSYLMFSYSDDPEKKMKAKGAYRWKGKLHEGYSYPVVAEAVRDHFDLGKPIEDTIYGEKNIFRFMKSERTDIKKFNVVLQKHSGVQLLQKHNRWVCTKGNPEEGKLYKVSKVDPSDRTEMEGSSLITCLNTVDPTKSIEDYHLNYEFYLRQATGMIHLTPQLNRDTHIKEEYLQQALF